MNVSTFRGFAAGAALVLAAAVATPSAAHAQLGFVVQGSYGTDVEAVGAGAGVNFGLGSLTTKNGIRGEATFDYFFPGDQGTGVGGYSYKFWEINGNAMMDVKSVKGLYVGAGVNYAHSSFDYNGGYCGLAGVSCSANGSDVGLNVLGGWKFGQGKSSPFAQARLELGGGSQLVLTGGVRF